MIADYVNKNLNVSPFLHNGPAKNYAHRRQKKMWYFGNWIMAPS